MKVGDKDQRAIAEAGIGKRQMNCNNIAISDLLPILLNISNRMLAGRFVQPIAYNVMISYIAFGPGEKLQTP